jgi:hypothetical protein
MKMLRYASSMLATQIHYVEVTWMNNLFKMTCELEGLDDLLEYYFASVLKETGYKFQTNWITSPDEEDWYVVSLIGQNASHYFDDLYEMDNEYHLDWFLAFEAVLNMLNDYLKNCSSVLDYNITYSSRYEIFIKYSGDCDLIDGFNIFRKLRGDKYV